MSRADWDTIRTPGVLFTPAVLPKNGLNIKARLRLMRLISLNLSARAAVAENLDGFRVLGGLMLQILLIYFGELSRSIQKQEGRADCVGGQGSPPTQF